MGTIEVEGYFPEGRTDAESGFFDRRNPIGMHLTLINEAGRRTPYEIVGVAGNARTHSLRGEVDPRFFMSAAQPPPTRTPQLSSSDP